MQLERAGQTYYYPSMRHPATLLFAILLVLLLAGCVSTTTTITIGENGSGSMRLEYVVDRSAYETGVFDSGGALPIPVARSDFENAAAAIDGIRLRQYRTTHGDDTVTVTATLSFDSIDALVSLFGPAWLTVTTDGTTTTWRQLLVPARDAAGESGYLAEDLDRYTMQFEIDPAPPIISVDGGSLVRNGDAAVAEISLGAIARGAQEQYLEVVW